MLALLIAAPLAAPAPAADVAAAPEDSPFDEKANASALVDAALARAGASGRATILVFGANWCGDSRALAGWFATPRFKAMLDPRYEIVWIDIGQRDRNIELARRFGLDGIKGTPTVLVLDTGGRPLNLKDAPRWKNARSRSEDAIYSAFETMRRP